MHVCVHTTCVSGIHGGQKRILDTMELKLLVFVNYHVCSRTTSQSFAKGTSPLNYRAISPAQDKYLEGTLMLYPLSKTLVVEAQK